MQRLSALIHSFTSCHGVPFDYQAYFFPHSFCNEPIPKILNAIPGKRMSGLAYQESGKFTVVIWPVKYRIDIAFEILNILQWKINSPLPVDRILVDLAIKVPRRFLGWFVDDSNSDQTVDGFDCPSPLFSAHCWAFVFLHRI